MNKEIKQRWVEALRSGKYKQGKAALRRKDRFCCLGVLCDITQTKKCQWKPKNRILGAYTIGGQTEVLPKAVVSRCRLAGENPSVIYKGKRTTLAQLNDEGVRFKTIAKLIEEQL